jgi:hypothetical protein
LLLLPAPAFAQQAGDIVVRVAAARTKLVDEGTIKVNGVVEPDAGYRTRAARRSTLRLRLRRRPTTFPPATSPARPISATTSSSWRPPESGFSR